MKKTFLTIVVIFAMLICIGLLVPADYQRVGCQSERGFKIARFHRDCKNPASNGYFKIANDYMSSCFIFNEEYDRKFMRSSNAYKLSLRLRASDLKVNTLGIDTQKDKIIIDIIAGEEGSRGVDSFCSSKNEPRWLDRVKDKSEKTSYETLSKLKDGQYVIKGLKSNISPRVVKKDIFFKVDEDKNEIYSIQCHENLNGRYCTGNGKSLINGRYEYHVTLPAKFENYFFDIMDSIPKFIGTLYVED